MLGEIPGASGDSYPVQARLGAGDAVITLERLAIWPQARLALGPWSWSPGTPAPCLAEVGESPPTVAGQPLKPRQLRLPGDTWLILNAH